MENRRNIALFFAAYFLEGLCFYGPVATLYRQAAGLTLLEIGTLESVSVAVMLLLELPWGWAADRLGHRRVIVVCTALYALSKVVFWRADGLWDFLLERLILAAALSGLSGCDSAYLYACGSRGDGQRRFGLWGAVQTAGLVTAGVCSTLFFSDDYRAAAGWTVAAYTLAALLTLFLTDPAGTAPPPEKRPPPACRAGLEPHPRPAAGGSGPFQRDGAVCGCLSQPAPVSALRHFPPVVWPALYPCGLGGHSRWVVPPPHGADGAAGWRCAPDGRRRSPLPGDGHLSPALGIGGGNHGPSGGGCAL